MNETMLDFATDNLPEDDYSLLPKGWYDVQIESAEIAPTKSGSGKILKLKLNVIGGEFGGRVLFDNINIVNANEKAQEIGRKQLQHLLAATGLIGERDVTKLCLKFCRASVRIDDGGNGYDPSNKINRYAAPGAAVAGQPTAKKRDGLKF